MPVIQSGDQRQNNSIRRKWSALALGGFLFTSIFALSAPSVEAQCEQYDVSGQWTIHQGSYVISVALSQNGKTVSGTASQVHGNTQGSGDVHTVHGQVNGTVEGDSFNVQINWSGGGAGAYSGTIGRGDYAMQGTTHDKNKPSSTASWFTDHHFDCADAAPVEPTTPTPARPKSIKSSGKMPASTPKPIKSSGKMPKTQSSAAAPTITAHPTAVTIPDGQSQGTVTLTWDGGPDHPDAEVWMKEGSQGEETLVVEQGKGTRSVTVERGKNYLFILKDAGQQVAKAVVISRQ